MTSMQNIWKCMQLFRCCGKLTWLLNYLKSDITFCIRISVRPLMVGVFLHGCHQWRQLLRESSDGIVILHRYSSASWHIEMLFRCLHSAHIIYRPQWRHHIFIYCLDSISQAHVIGIKTSQHEEYKMFNSCFLSLHIRGRWMDYTHFEKFIQVNVCKQVEKCNHQFFSNWKFHNWNCCYTIRKMFDTNTCVKISE